MTATTLRREREALVRDDRAFDVKVIRSALEFINRSPDARAAGDYPSLTAEVFGWIPEVLAARAKLAGIAATNVTWTSYEVDDGARAVTFLLMLAVDRREMKMKDGRVLHMDILAQPDTSRIGAFGAKLTAREWFERALVALPIYSRFVFDGPALRRAEVALITNVQRVLAYALAVLLQDRWEIRDRLRCCPYTRRGIHFFLDYRTDDQGRFLPGEPMKYCCPKHSNAHRQQRWRDEPKDQT